MSGAVQLAARDMTLPRALPIDELSGLGGDLSLLEPFEVE